MKDIVCTIEQTANRTVIHHINLVIYRSIVPVKRVIQRRALIVYHHNFVAVGDQEVDEMGSNKARAPSNKALTPILSLGTCHKLPFSYASQSNRATSESNEF
jgi:hypothetical protein